MVSHNKKNVNFLIFKGQTSLLLLAWVITFFNFKPLNKLNFFYYLLPKCFQNTFALI